MVDTSVPNPTELSSVVAPTLIIAFNRPSLMRRQIEVLRTVRVSRIFIAVDGPRPHVPSDSIKRAEVLSCLDLIDWPCVVERRISDVNLGLNEAIVRAIDWFFDHVDEGIILEDDCIPRSDFFRFATELLERFRDNPHIMHISGTSMMRHPNHPQSYVFAPVGHIWGWATWKDAWQRLDPDLSKWPEIRSAVRRSGFLGRALARKFDASRAGRKSRWARWWYYSMVRDGGLAVVPSINLVENDGFGADATNTVTSWHPLNLRADLACEFPLRHPADTEIDQRYVRMLARYHNRSFRDRTADRIAAIRLRVSR